MRKPKYTKENTNLQSIALSPNNTVHLKHAHWHNYPTKPIAVQTTNEEAEERER